jgi:hypothetical protein
MKVRALKRFRDKKTNVIHEKDDVFEVSKARAAEMNAAPAGPLVAEIKKE